MNLHCRRARFGAEEAMRSLGLVSRVVPGSRAEILRVTIVDNAEVIERTSPVTVVNGSSPMRSIIRACCFVLRLLMNLFFSELVDDMICALYGGST
jgi:hypothetical protein